MVAIRDAAARAAQVLAAAPPVVVRRGDAEQVLELAALEDQEPFEAFGADGATEGLGLAFACGQPASGQIRRAACQWRWRLPSSIKKSR